MLVAITSWLDCKGQKIIKTVADEITGSIVRNTKMDAKYVYVLFEDIKPSDWAVADEFLSSEGNGE